MEPSKDAESGKENFFEESIFLVNMGLLILSDGRSLIVLKKVN